MWMAGFGLEIGSSGPENRPNLEPRTSRPQPRNLVLSVVTTHRTGDSRPPSHRITRRPAVVDCPRPDNATAWCTVPGTSLAFERVCGVDTTAGDMGRFPATSMADCLAVCAQLNLYPSSAMGRCLGISWVFCSGLQGQGSSYCYPKYNVSMPRSRRTCPLPSTAMSSPVNIFTPQRELSSGLLARY
ncbi:hypothetical protein MAPG_09231 [Magnaporthiopsis poae ATCC 64411]|uniref:Apple domain-containing protein n=1 Tax=Magnaporthiopsis poae (strain ATCC 64411 / 73-15) TaxID=644358 RepID=A0A0C4E9E7_MAGP6|nr:hypothetical protein MAPG_09231 [Magnaporthiopsis poae ATCC 64411]